MAKINSLNISKKKSIKKTPVQKVEITLEGLAGDAHSGDWHRMISLLALESVDKMRAAGLNVGPGDFAENITTEGVDLLALPLGTRVRLGQDVIVEITQHGKECHDRCAIYHEAGDCVMPKEGVFAKVEKVGELKTGDIIEVLA